MKKIFLLSLLFLTACATPEQIAEKKRLQLEQDRQTCRDYGFRPRSDAFSNCMLQLEIAREQRQYYYDSGYPRFHGSYHYFRH